LRSSIINFPFTAGPRRHRYFAMSDRLMQPFSHAMTILIGDVAGAVIVLSLLLFVLTFFISRPRV
jgi:hypothetical protein